MKKLLFLLLLFALVFPLPMSADENLCPQFSQHSAGEGFVDYESHEYINGFLSIHFKLAPNSNHKLGTAYKLLRSSDCQEAAPGGWWSMGTFDIPQEVNNFSIRFYQRINFGEYKYRVYNDDTNQVINCDACDTGFWNMVYFGGEPPHKFWLTLYTPYDFGYIPNLSVLPPTRFIASAPDIEQPEYTGKTPVLIVPGVLGSNLIKGDSNLWVNPVKMVNDFSDQFMDPLQFTENLVPLDSSILLDNVIRKESYLFFDFDYTFGLINIFSNQGYTENKDLFTFPYDWRYGVTGVYGDGTNNVGKLKQKIEAIKLQTGSPKVDIIAHSNGGLLVKKYVMENPSNHSINKAIFVGVPNLGAPKAVKVLLQGDNFGVKGLSDEEMKKIAKNMPGVYDLAPGKNYFDAKGSYVKIIEQKFMATDPVRDLDFSAVRQFLGGDHGLNYAAYDNGQALHNNAFENFDLRTAGVDMYNIVGCKSGTIGGITEVRSKDFFGNPLFNYRRPSIVSGDETVPYESANSIKVDDGKVYYAKKYTHSEMLSANGTRELIVNLILGQNLLKMGSNIIPRQGVLADPSHCELNGKKIDILSPVDIEVFDQSGNRLGKAADGSLESNIPGADINVFGDKKFVYLPTDSGEVYDIKLKGEGEGRFTLNVQDISGSQEGSTEVFPNLPVSPRLLGNLSLGANSSVLKLDNNGDGVVDNTLNPAAVLNPNQSQDLLPPVSTSTLVGTMGQPGFYRSNVQITLSAKDVVVPGYELETSGLLSLKFRLDNASSTPYSTYSSPILVEGEGKHTLEFFSTDKAGNNEEVQTVNFVIDKTAPEFTIQFNTVSKDFDYAATDNQDIPVSIVCNTTQCSSSDMAGNASIFKYEKKSLANSKNLLLKSINYNRKITNFDPNLFNVIYSLNKGEMAEISQTILIKNQQVANIMYNRKLNQSIYTDWSKGTKPVITKLEGLKYLQLQTNNSKIKVNQK